MHAPFAAALIAALLTVGALPASAFAHERGWRDHDHHDRHDRHGRQHRHHGHDRPWHHAHRPAWAYEAPVVYSPAYVSPQPVYMAPPPPVVYRPAYPVYRSEPAITIGIGIPPLVIPLR
ncbi:MAG: hypothetical protein KA603_08650 [Azonexus sp.]|nr:hypothetical protein [Betaproteobacteria bacterium]MBK8918262.1 hypothetical protein [Betaproteobacteria bacterium]MBP6036188.1 hypothetical protein [Azonexus sp.]MBP6906711.1 hypothetical protein [Azonexus sp.]